MFTTTITLFFLLAPPLQEVKPIVDNSRVTIRLYNGCGAFATSI